MSKKSVQHWQLLPSIFKIIIILVLLLGFCFRFANLSDRPYWHDETYTLLRTSGHTILEMTQNLFQGQVVNRDTILQYQTITPEKTLTDVFYSFITEEPQRSPLYYLLARGWMQLFGNSVPVTRLFSGLISLLTFPSLYWLCMELFAQPMTAWIAIALVAVSPFHVHYAQEAREYSLWTVTLLLTNATLLRALRLKTPSAWSLYCITVILSLYTSVLTGFITAVHFLYVMTIARWRRTEQSVSFLKALGVGLVAFLPWLSFSVVRFSQVEETSAWMKQTIPLPSLMQQWFKNLLYVFFRNHLTKPWHWCVALAIVSLIGIAAVSLRRRSPKNTWLFVTGLVFLPFLSLAIPDVVFGGIRSTNGRYFLPSFLGIQITVAFLLATQLIQTYVYPWQKQIQWRLVTVLLISLGLVSCWLQLVRHPRTDDQAMAQLINQAAPAIVISNEVSLGGGGTIGDVLVLSHLVNSQTQFQLVIPPQVPTLPPRSQVFLYKPFDLLKQQIRSQCIPKPIYQDKLFECQRVQSVAPPFSSKNS